MKGNAAVKNALSHYKENELILAGKLYRSELADKVSECAYYKTLERMCGSGELIKIAKGTYHLPKANRYGLVPPSEKEIVAAFTENEKGTVVGYDLYNTLNLTTQIAKTTLIFSSAIDGITKSIRNVVIRRARLRYTKEISEVIHCLDVLQNFYHIQDLNVSAFIKFAESFAESYDEKALEKVIAEINYKKSTISFLQEILNFYGKENSLSAHLSALSDYKHPGMEELYEAARISRQVQ